MPSKKAHCNRLGCRLWRLHRCKHRPHKAENAHSLPLDITFREVNEIQRIHTLRDMLVGKFGCMNRFLTSYYNESDENSISQCGHCEACLSGSALYDAYKATANQQPTQAAPDDMSRARERLAELASECHAAGLTSARQIARFAWGVKSPALRQLQKSPRFASMRSDYSFNQLLHIYSDMPSGEL